MDIGHCALGLPPSVWTDCECVGPWAKDWGTGMHRSLEQSGWLLDACGSDLGEACGF